MGKAIGLEIRKVFGVKVTSEDGQVSAPLKVEKEAKLEMEDEELAAAGSCLRQVEIAV
jgi:hypothetical protein